MPSSKKQANRNKKRQQEPPAQPSVQPPTQPPEDVDSLLAQHHTQPPEWFDLNKILALWNMRSFVCSPGIVQQTLFQQTLFQQKLCKLSRVSDESLFTGFVAERITLEDVASFGSLSNRDVWTLLFHYHKVLLDENRSTAWVVNDMFLRKFVASKEFIHRLYWDTEFLSALHQHPRAHLYFVPELTVNPVGPVAKWTSQTFETWSPLQPEIRSFKKSENIPLFLMRFITLKDFELTISMLLMNVASHVLALREFFRHKGMPILLHINALAADRQHLNLQLFDLEVRMYRIDSIYEHFVDQPYKTFNWTEQTDLEKDIRTRHKEMSKRIMHAKREIQRILAESFDNVAHQELMETVKSLFYHCVFNDPKDVNLRRLDIIHASVYEKRCCNCGRFDCIIFSALQEGREVYDKL